MKSQTRNTKDLKTQNGKNHTVKNPGFKRSPGYILSQNNFDKKTARFLLPFLSVIQLDYPIMSTNTDLKNVNNASINDVSYLSVVFIFSSTIGEIVCVASSNTRY